MKYLYTSCLEKLHRMISVLYLIINLGNFKIKTPNIMDHFNSFNYVNSMKEVFSKVKSMFFKENKTLSPYFGVSKRSKNFFRIRKKSKNKEKISSKKITSHFLEF